MNLMCIVFVMFKVGDMTFFSKAEIAGIMLSETKTEVIGDFSKDALDKEYLGSYKKVKVKKSECRGFGG
jgi:hypothetical protein